MLTRGWHWTATMGVAGCALGLGIVVGQAGGAGVALGRQSQVCNFPGADQSRLQAFLDAGCYRDWIHDPEIHSTGPIIDGQSFSTHGRARIFYSPEVYGWLLAGRPPGGIPEGAMIVKEQYPPLPEQGDTLEGWTTMVRVPGESWDGWFWSSYFLIAGPPNLGEFGYSPCIACHASTDVPEMTFASLENILGRGEKYDHPDPSWTVYSSHALGAHLEPPPGLPQPLRTPDEGFLRLFSQIQPVPEDQVLKFPSSAFDHVVAAADGPERFLTSDQCVGCHNSSVLLTSFVPNMVATDRHGTRVNLSPFGEWSASLMGLSGRDPVFHAQIESELALRPSLSEFINDTCFSCHGVMGQRQLHLDRGEPFTYPMFYTQPGQPYAKYGALARDGVSCLACHGMDALGLGEPSTFTGQFNLSPSDQIHGPYQDPKTYSMLQAMGTTPSGADYITSSAMCGSCHVVILPEVPRSYTGRNPLQDRSIHFEHEQTTYLEWRNSAYQNEWEPVNRAVVQTCQGCHMPQTFEGNKLVFQIANIQDEVFPPVHNRAPDEEVSLPEREPYGRHTLVGLNVFVQQMFQQFTSILGIPSQARLSPVDAAQPLKMAEASSLDLARETAGLEIVSAQWGEVNLDVVVRVTNLAGHKLPSGVGFRRAFLEFSVVDRDQRVLWSSGRTSPYGVILDGDGRSLETEFSKTTWQPHYEVIDRQDAAQIYEERHLDDQGELTTSFLSLFTKVKDNRLLPLGWRADGPDVEFMEPVGAERDPRYQDGSGSDEVLYRAPTAAIPGAAAVHVRLHYQAIPPYYLRDRFETASGPETQRLHHLASRLTVADTAIQNWRLEVASATRQLSGD